MLRRRVWLAVLLLGAVVLLSPLLLDLPGLRRLVRTALERELGGAVALQSVRGALLPRPALVGTKVRFQEEEPFGLEPFLLAEEVRCYLPLATLWQWRLTCNRIHFVRPSINVVRNAAGQWNLGQHVGAKMAVPDGDDLLFRPLLSGTEGRIHFKQELAKSVFALADVEFRAVPMPDGSWQLQLGGAPMRTDRRVRAPGRLSLAGSVAPGDLRFQLNANLESGSLAQLVVLASGRSPRLVAEAAVTAQLEGIPEEWTAQGNVTLAGLRRWDLPASPRTPRWEGDFSLRFRDGGRIVEVERGILRGAESEIQVKGRTESSPEGRQWNFSVMSQKLALDELWNQLAAFRTGIPLQTRLGGTAHLALRIPGPLRTWEGEITTPDEVLLHSDNTENPVRAIGLGLLLREGQLELAPLEISFTEQDRLVASGDWQLEQESLPFRLHWQSQDVYLPWLEDLGGAVGMESVGLENWEGRASLDLEWRGSRESWPAVAWEGQAEIREGSYNPPEFSAPLVIAQAGLRWRRGRLRVDPLTFVLGDERVSAVLERRRPDLPWTVEAQAEKMSLETLAELLGAGQQGLLARLVSTEEENPRRWKNLKATGQVSVRELTAGPFLFRRLQAAGRWREGRLDLNSVRFRAYGGRFVGNLEGDFFSDPPRYRLAGNLTKIRLQDLVSATSEWGDLIGGLAGAEIDLQAVGSRPPELLRSLAGHVAGALQDGALQNSNLLRAMGVAAGMEEPVGPPGVTTPLQSLGGDFRVADQKVFLEAVQVILDRARFELEGQVAFDGSLDLRLRGEPLADQRPRASSLAQLLQYSYRIGGNLRRVEVQVADPMTGEAQR